MNRRVVVVLVVTVALLAVKTVYVPVVFQTRVAGTLTARGMVPHMYLAIWDPIPEPGMFDKATERAVYWHWLAGELSVIGLVGSLLALVLRTRQARGAA